MKPSLYKGLRGVEFCELFDHLKAFKERVAGVKFRPADMARLCKLSEAAVSMYLSGKKEPGERVLDIVRVIVNRESGAASPAELPEGNIVVNKLLELERSDPRSYAAAKSTIEVLHDRLTKEEPNSESSLVEETERAVMAAEVARVLGRPATPEKGGGGRPIDVAPPGNKPGGTA